jgi:hypothetical protein
MRLESGFLFRDFAVLLFFFKLIPRFFIRKFPEAGQEVTGNAIMAVLSGIGNSPQV